MLMCFRGARAWFHIEHDRKQDRVFLGNQRFQRYAWNTSLDRLSGIMFDQMSLGFFRLKKMQDAFAVEGSESFENIVGNIGLTISILLR